ncbi:glycosyltransferase family 8 protein [Didymella exigua CBS 183.55]|uniref:glycogenin glucosyltransferase n=1 Tax=Didymella exigua CBS 183.55 TaxID=1150837 RepID=A0A6A5RBY7_9PLEO|nr:glycosyltransferase family 8 protein [Didymella exigua CBS 183.55]KAF1924584.1 glycosyltransferase family 8 protein [Didymella exigua CBS 183.55]
MAPALEDVYCTLLMSDSYLPGAAVLAHSLRDAGTAKKLAVMITLESLSAETITELKLLYDYVIPVERIRNTNMANLYLMGRPDLSYAFTKIALWRQTQFRKIVYLDADVVALRALDELFDIEASFAAAPDIGWPDAFNSGVMVLNPDMGEYWSLHTKASAGDSFDGADQGLLNQYFEHRPWQRLKFTYNCTPNAEYQWEPAYRYHKRDISAVHFIGKDKPWSPNRTAGSGVYGELLARWWAVHNRHLQDKRSARRESKITGEVQSSSGTSTNYALQPQSVPDITIGEPAPTAEPSMTDPSEAAEDIDQGLVEPTPTVQQRQFSAPEMQWDATKFEPPAQSKPEAANFPRETYTFNESRQLFNAPSAYPEPPRDMWYKVPETKPQPYEAPKPIFPWERESSRPKPTRVFAEDHPPPAPAPAPATALAPEVSEFEASPPTSKFTTTHFDHDSSQDQWTRAKPTRVWIDDHPPFKPRTAEESWQAFSQSSANAWDSVPGIDNYVRSIMETQTKRDKVQGLQQATGTNDLGSPLLSRKDRRESLILTDFPTAVERPSLPVTPAPVRRPTFWGEERDEQGELPAAEGVPDQNEWNPEAKLEQLRRSSVVEFEHLKKDEHPEAPLRALPEHSVLGDEHGEELQVGGIVVAKSDRPAARFSTRPTSTEQSASSQHSSLSSSLKGGRGNKIGFTMDDFGTSFERREKSANSFDGPTFPFEDTTPVEAFPKVEGFTERDFGGDSTNDSEIQYASTITHHSMGPGHHVTSDGRIKAGELTFNIPGFNSESTSELISPIGDALSPTTTREDRNGHGTL